MNTRALTAGAAFAALLVAGSGVASASWSTAVSGGVGATKAATLGAPTAGSATVASATSLTISWSAPTGVAPTGYTLTRNAASIGSGGCSGTIAATSCTDSGLTTGTTYTYTVTAKRSAWASSASTSFTGTPTATDVTPPTISSTTCPTPGNNYDLANSGSTSWGKTCSPEVQLTITDTTGVASAKIKIQTGTVCYNGAGSFTVAGCTGGDGSGYFAATHGAGNLWTLTVTKAAMQIAVPSGSGSKTFTLSALATDTASPANSTPSGTPFNFTFQANN